MTARQAVILGASGIVGRALAEHLGARDGWRVVGVSRRDPGLACNMRFLPVDLTDRAACESALSKLPDTTHVFYAAFVQRERPAEEIAPNLAMLRHAVEVLDAHCPRLAHVQLTQGSKWYGNHLGPYRTPAREDQPRHPFPHFYFDQQEWLARFQQGRPWTWSAVRPHGIWGFAVGGQINMMLAIALYATVLRHMGLPLYYPGKPGAFDALYQCTEASYLARGMVWAATEAGLSNEAVNFTNGDFIRWRDAWPLVAQWFGMPAAGVLTFDLGEFMRDKEPMWAEIRRQHGLQEFRMDQLTQWGTASSNLFNADWDQASSMTKARNLGWTGVNDTFGMIPRQLDLLARRRIIPDYGGAAGRAAP